jgi:hypothetical protein
MKIATHHAARPHPLSEEKYDWKGAVVRALINDQNLDTDSVPKRALSKIGSGTDTTYTYTKAFIGHDAVFVHADDMMARTGMSEGFIAATAAGKVVASGSFNTDVSGKFIPSSIRFDRKPTGL